MSKKEVLMELAKFIPNEVRRDLVKKLYDMNDQSIKRTAEDMKTSRIQIYRYLALSKRRNYPSDIITARALGALYLKQPQELINFLKEQTNKIKALIERLQP